MEKKSQESLDLRLFAPYLLVLAALAGLGAAMAGKPEPSTGHAAEPAATVQADSPRGEASTGVSAPPTESPEGDGNVFMYN